MGIIATVLKGFAMGASDIVPGVSGGTVALVLGIYERLLANVRSGAKTIGSVVSLRFTEAKAALAAIEYAFILPLGVGSVFAIVTLSGQIEHWLKTNPEEVAGFFLGLVAASIVVAYWLVTQRTQMTWRLWLVVATVGVVSFIVLGFQSGQVSSPPLWAFFVSGMVALCAMILPGISGSFILLMCGMYAAVLGAVHERDLLPLAVFAFGGVAGLGLFSNVLGKALEARYGLVMSSLIGLLVGSIRVVWPWPNGVGLISEDVGETVPGTTVEWPSDNFWAPAALALLGFVFVLGVSRVAKSLESGTAVGS